MEYITYFIFVETTLLISINLLYLFVSTSRFLVISFK